MNDYDVIHKAIVDSHKCDEPTETIDITENGIVDVVNYASANVNVAGGGGGNLSELAPLESKGLLCYHERLFNTRPETLEDVQHNTADIDRITYYEDGKVKELNLKDFLPKIQEKPWELNVILDKSVYFMEHGLYYRVCDVPNKYSYIEVLNDAFGGMISKQTCDMEWPEDNEFCATNLVDAHIGTFYNESTSGSGNDYSMLTTFPYFYDLNDPTKVVSFYDKYGQGDWSSMFPEGWALCFIQGTIDDEHDYPDPVVKLIYFTESSD